jgi:glutamate formiminotransferase / 5-formyltetrahydrofolate cyclo-ligase
MLIECVPNVSEGVNARVIESLRQEILRGGSTLLHSDSGESANRTVFTYCGTPQAVVKSSINLIEAAIQQIDLRHHLGTHPRIGAVDVLPFIPLEAATLSDCDICAREVARICADKLQLPFFLYEDSQPISDRKNLPFYRIGGFEKLTERFLTGELRSDFGPQSPHPSAGAVVIGARPFLIAYNVDLQTDDVATARRIAASIREQSGGSPRVRAIGWPCPERHGCQVSCNLLDFRVTPPVDVFTRIQELAAHEGVLVMGAELVGVIPMAALVSEGESKKATSRTELSEMLLQRAVRIGLSSHEFLVEKQVLEYLLDAQGLREKNALSMCLG